MRTEIASAEWSIFQGDMMRVSKVGIMVMRNVEDAVNARGLQVKRPRTERVVMQKAKKRDETGKDRA